MVLIKMLEIKKKLLETNLIKKLKDCAVGQSFDNNDLLTDPLMPDLEDSTSIFRGAYDDEDVGAEADLNNLETTMNVNLIPTTRIHKDHPKDQIIRDINSAIQTWRMINFFEENSMVWTLVDLPKGKRAIGTKWVYRNKKDERGIVVRNKERLVMDVKSAFLYGTIKEEVYVCQPLGFEDPQFPDKVYKVEKALYGLNQAHRAWYETFSTYLIENGFRRGTIDKTLFIKKDKGDILLAQVYVDDIIFGSTNKSLCDEFEQMMHKKFQMSSMGELTFFLGLQTASTPMEPIKALVKDEEADSVDVHLYRSMIGSLMYLIASRPDITFVVCACASDYARASLDKKSITGGCQFLGKRLISWQCKKQIIVANSTTKVEYDTAANYYGQVLWIQNQMLDYGFNFMNTKIYIDNESTICVVKNLVFHSKTKHIEIRHHFIRDSYEKKLIQVIKIHTDHNVVDLLTKAFDVSRADLSFVNQHNMVVYLEKSDENAEFHQIVDFLFTCSINYALIVSPTIYSSYIKQFWNTTTSKILNSVKKIHAIVDGKAVVITKSSVRNDLLFDDEDGSFTPQWKFLLKDLPEPFNDTYETPSHTKKVFSNMARQSKSFSGKVTPLFESMLVQNQAPEGESSVTPPEPQPTPSTSQPNVSEPQTELLQTETPPTVSHEPQTEANIEQILPSPSIYQRKHRKTQKHRRAKKVTELPQTSVPLDLGADEAVHKEGVTGMDTGMDTRWQLRRKRKTIGTRYCSDYSERVLKSPSNTLSQKLHRLEVRRAAWNILLNRWTLYHLYLMIHLSQEEDASKQGRISDKIKPMFKDSDFDDLDDLVDEGMAFVQEKDAENQGKIGADDIEAINTAGEGVSTVAPRTPPTTTTVFDDDDVTIAMAQTLIKMKKEKAKEKGVAIKDVEDFSRPIKSITTLQPLTIIDPKDKGKGVLVEEEPKKPEKVKRRDQGLAQIESDAELAERLHEEELAELDRAQKEKQKQEEATNAALAKEFDAIQPRMDADHKLAYTHQQLKHKTLEELQKLYQKEQKWINDFKPMDSEEDGSNTKKDGKRIKRIAYSTSKKKSPKKSKWVAVVPDEDETVDPEILSVKYPIVDWESQNLGSVDMEDIHRVLSGKISSDDTRVLFSKVVAIFNHQFDLIADSTTRRLDLSPYMVYGRSLKQRDYGRMYCAILTVNSKVASAGIFRIFGNEVAELPLVATSKLLPSLNVKILALLAADEAESIWTDRFWFEKIPDVEVSGNQYAYWIHLVSNGGCRNQETSLVTRVKVK
ncbi:putative ribonuclease H-like domain-containing protein [Tanacetum coccineum]